MISKLVIEILENKKKSSSKINIPSIIVAEKINPNTLAELESKNLKFLDRFSLIFIISK